MTGSIDRYLSTLLSYTPAHKRYHRFAGDYLSLVHVPANGAERVYSVVCNPKAHILTTVRYRETVWKSLEDRELVGDVEFSPQVDVLRTSADATHPIFKIIDQDLLSACRDQSDGGEGMDYFMLMWQKDGEASVVECWEPFGRDDANWTTLISAVETLASQYEFAAAEA